MSSQNRGLLTPSPPPCRLFYHLGKVYVVTSESKKKPGQITTAICPDFFDSDVTLSMGPAIPLPLPSRHSLGTAPNDRPLEKL